MLLTLLSCAVPTPEVEKPPTEETGWWDGDPCDDTTAKLSDEDSDGFLICEGDCDENNAEVNPGATELCNGIDDDCDTLIDEEVENTYYADADGDGFGDPAVTTIACDAPAGYVQNSADCDDAQPRAYPGAYEVCDGVDNNCDATPDASDCACEVSTFADHTYTFCGGPVSWEVASAACAALGAHLVTIHDAAEDDWLHTLTPGWEWWIGYTDRAVEGTWVWEDGSASTYTDWLGREPDGGEAADCAAIGYGRWGDHGCGELNGYVCEQ